MHSHILTYIILPNVGYWRGEKITSQNLLSHTKKVLSIAKEIKKYTVYMLDNRSYREGDLPLIEYDGNKLWCKNGKLGRKNDLPAVERSNGDKGWYKNGKLNRKDDLPAIVLHSGDKLWYKNGRRHREGDLPAVECSDGSKEWWKKGKRHREGDLPAVEFIDGYKQWYKHGKYLRDNLHRNNLQK